MDLTDAQSLRSKLGIPRLIGHDPMFDLLERFERIKLPRAAGESCRVALEKLSFTTVASPRANVSRISRRQKEGNSTDANSVASGCCR